jgi:hypothetical protein
MHYLDMNLQAIDKSKPTMKGIKGKELSEIDIEEIRKLYNCKSAGI